MIVVLAVLILAYNVLRRRRMGRAASNRSGIKNVFSIWTPSTPYDTLSARARPRTHASTARTSSEVPTSSVNESSTPDPERLDHRLSVRSIATLPPYRVAPLPSEQLIAREGERAGVDTVVEYPESEGEVEDRREEEMQALYNIREARRREQAEREARRIERREARERGDWRRVQVLEEESRQRARARNASTASALTVEDERRGSSTSSTTQLTTTTSSHSQLDSSYLIAELNSLRETNTRNRRVSSVSYAELGVARHDGSRIRADSIDSDNRPLLDSAASMGGGRSRSRATSTVSSRDGSRSGSRAAHPGSRGYDHRPSTRDSFISQDEDTSEYLGHQDGADLPLDPPSYDDDVSVHGGEAPPYESPVAERAPQLPAPPKPAHVASPGALDRAVSPTPSPLRQAISHFDGSSSTVHESDDGFELTPTAAATAAATTNGMPPLRLNTTTESQPPAIEVLSATPIDSLPPTPGLHGRFNYT